MPTLEKNKFLKANFEPLLGCFDVYWTQNNSTEKRVKS